MINTFLFNTITCFIIISLQVFISYLFSTKIEKKEINLIDLYPFAFFSLFYGIIFTISDKVFSYHLQSLSSIIGFSSLMVGYWFFIAPLFNLLNKKSNYRDFEIERQLKDRGFKYIIIFSDDIKNNAYSTGCMPFFKLILIASNLKNILSKEELFSVIFHEIGHHEKKHLVKLYAINLLIFSFYVYSFLFLFNLKLGQPYETFLVFILGTLGGLIFYYFPNLFLYFCEYSADRFSANLNNKEDLINALIKFDKLTNGSISKGNINHPSLDKRIKNIDNRKK